MKKIILSILVLTITFQSFGQPGTPTDQYSSDYFKMKSKKQRTAAWLMAGGGAVLCGTGLAIMSASALDEVAAWFEDSHDSNYGTGSALLVTGTLCMLGSVPLFIAAGKNRKKALAVSSFIKPEERPYVYQRSIKRTQFPAIGIKINL